MKHINNQFYVWGTYFGQLLIAIAILVAIYQRIPTAVLTLSLFLGASLYFLHPKNKLLPPLYDFLLTIAALINAAGWSWDFYNTINPYDEIAHAYSTFAITLTVGHLTYRNFRQAYKSNKWLYIITISSLGIALGTFWEIAEWIADFFVAKQVVKSLTDVETDLILDSLGALVAGIVSSKLLSKYKS